MPVRVVELFRLGSFRMAIRPGLLGLNWQEGFELLERHLAGLGRQLAAMPYDRFVKPRSEDFPERPGPRHGDREGWVNLVVDPSTPDHSIRVFLRGSLPFTWWPVGCWVVWDGFRVSRDSAPKPLSAEELSEAW